MWRTPLWRMFASAQNCFHTPTGSSTGAVMSVGTQAFLAMSSAINGTCGVGFGINYFTSMASMPALRLVPEAIQPTSVNGGDEPREPSAPPKSRAQRFAESQARVLERYAETFRKLAE